MLTYHIKVLGGIYLWTVSQEVLMNVISGMCLEITLLDLLPQLSGKKDISILFCRFHRMYENRFLPWWRHPMKTFSALLTICAMNSPHKGQWRGALMFSFISGWISGWVNNREAGDLECHRAHYDVIVMFIMDRCSRLFWDTNYESDKEWDIIKGIPLYYSMVGPICTKISFVPIVIIVICVE